MKKAKSLAGELFKYVELEQGRAFISDGLDVLTDAQIVAIARGSLFHTRRVERQLLKFLKKYGHLNEAVAKSASIEAARKDK